MAVFKRSLIVGGIDVYKDKSFTHCHECNKPTIVEFLWKKNYLCQSCYSSHSMEREETRKAVEQHKPMKCTTCSVVKINHDHTFYYHPHDVFEPACIKKMIQTGVDKEEICRTVDRFEPLCMECYHFVMHFENEWLDRMHQCKNKYLQTRYEIHTKDVYQQLTEIMKEKYST
jgi:hypothetical protein